MRNRTCILGGWRITGLILGLAVTTAAAKDDFELLWFTIDGGGAQAMTGGTFELSATAGQPDVGEAAGGALELDGGFWPGFGEDAANPCPDRSKTKGTYKPGNVVSAGLVRYAPNRDYQVELLDKDGIVLGTKTLTTGADGKAKGTFRNVDCTGAPHKVRNVVCDVRKSVKKTCGP